MLILYLIISRSHWHFIFGLIDICQYLSALTVTVSITGEWKEYGYWHTLLRWYSYIICTRYSVDKGAVCKLKAAITKSYFIYFCDTFLLNKIFGTMSYFDTSRERERGGLERLSDCVITEGSHSLFSEPASETVSGSATRLFIQQVSPCIANYEDGPVSLKSGL